MQTRLYLNRWLTFVASCLMQTCAGLGYVFPVYAPALKEMWGYHETQIATVGSCFNIGGYLAIPAGVLYDRLEKHKRFGPRFVSLIGSLLLAAGYLGLYAAASGMVAPSFAFVCVCAVLGGNSSPWFDTTAIVTNVRNFPRDRGTVVGILKAFVGLSASIYSSIYAAAFASGGATAAAAAINFLFFVGVASPLVTLALTAAMNLVPEAYHEPEPGAVAELPAAAEPQPPPATAAARRSRTGPAAPRFSAQARFTFAYCLVAVVALYQAAAALWAGAAHPSPHSRRVLLGGLLTLLAALLALPLSSGDWVHRKPRPEVVERLRRGLLARLAEHGAKAAAILRRSRRGSGGGADAASGGGGGLAEPLLAVVAESVDGNGDGDDEGEGLRVVTATAVLYMPGGGGGGVDTGAACKGSEARQDGLAAAAMEGAMQQRTVKAAEEPGERGGERGGEAAEAAVEEAPGASAAGLPEEQPPPQPPVVREGDLEAQVEALEEVPALPDMRLGEAVRSPIFWLLALQFGVGLGSGLSFLNNLGSIVVALGGQPGGQVVFVSLFSVANATGRLTGGVLSELALRRYGTPRTLLLVAVSFLTLLAVGCAAASDLSDLYGTSVLMGLAFGAHWGLIPAITSDLFGLPHFGSNYTALQLGPAAGGYLLATVLTGKMYDRVAKRHGDRLFCLGADCYFETWCLLGGLNLAALLGSRELYAQSGGRYRRLVRGGGV